MLTPKENGAASISHRTGGLRRPWSSDERRMLRISASTDVRGFGAKPTSCIARHATTKVTSSRIARTAYGTPRLVTCASTPPATVLPSMAMPVAVWPLAKADSRGPAYPDAVSPSTSHASVAPLKNVKPRPSSADAAAHAANGAVVCHSTRYSSVDPNRVAAPSRYDARRPTVSATTPVGTSNSTIPAVKNAFAAKASVMDSPASSRKSVLTPQISDEALVATAQSMMYVRSSGTAAGFTRSVCSNIVGVAGWVGMWVSHEVVRRYAVTASGAKAATMPAVQVRARNVSPAMVWPAGRAAWPRVRPRSVLATMVMGWCSAKTCSQPGMVWVGRKTELVRVMGKTTM